MTDHVSTAVRSDLRVERMGNIAIVTLDRPPVNAVSLATYDEIVQAFDELSGSTEFDVAVLRSAHEGFFCAGADLKEVADVTGDADDVRQLAAHRALASIRLCSIPVIAAVEGRAIGAGTAFAACADIRVAASDAVFSMPEVAVARAGGGRHLMRTMTQGWMRLMYFTAQPITAEQAFAAGFVQEVTKPAAAFEAALRIARAIAGNSPMALRLSKEAINLAEQMTVEDGYRLEQQFTLRLAKSPDALEARRAFAERRDPVWHRPEPDSVRS